jgi:16S rRNA (cytosine1402-N4)-methyltransferase
LGEPTIIHEPVLCDALAGILSYGAGATVVDATVGQAGHALLLAGRLNQDGLLVGLDVDANSLAVAQQRLREAACRVELRRENFGQLDEVLRELGVGAVDVILADIGVSSAQLADDERGLSFQKDGPLDMRLDDRLETTAADLVNRLDQEDLADVIWRYGEERQSRRIARGIVAARKKKPLERTGELAEVISRSLGITGPGRRSKIHPATRTFQALRIAVNDELGALERLLTKSERLLKVGGQIAVISFHSLEDRLVKYDFRAKAAAGRYEILTRKPVVAQEEERRRNPRSRSAKLRVARRIEEKDHVTLERGGKI